MAEDLYHIVKEEVEIVASDQGGFNSGHLWKIKKKLRPKYQTNPTAMMNMEGKTVTSSDEIKKASMEHFKHVLTNRPMNPNLQEYKEERETFCEERIKIASKNISPDWSEKSVHDVITKFKKKKSRDPFGISNEIIQGGGKYVVTAITKLVNGI